MPSEEFSLKSQLTTPHLPLSSKGRWLSPDPLAGDLTNPQSLNRYAYVLNNPTNLTDPLGLYTWWAGNCEYDTVSYFVDGHPSGTETFLVGCTGGYTMPVNIPDSGGGGGGANAANTVSMTAVLQNLHNCAGNKANQLSVASLTGLQNSKFWNFFLSNSIATAAQLSYGAPTVSGAASSAGGIATDEAAGAAAKQLSGLGTGLTSYTMSGISRTYAWFSAPAGTVAVEGAPVIEMAAPSAASRVLGTITMGAAKVLANAFTLQSAYDAVVYTGALVACGQQAGVLPGGG